METITKSVAFILLSLILTSCMESTDYAVFYYEEEEQTYETTTVTESSSQYTY